MKSFTRLLSWLWNTGSHKEKVAALVVFGFFVAVYFLIPSQIPVAFVRSGEDIGYSPRFFPRVVAVFTIILSLILLIRSYSKSATPDALEGPRKGILGTKPVMRAMPVIIII